MSWLTSSTRWNAPRSSPLPQDLEHDLVARLGQHGLHGALGVGVGNDAPQFAQTA